MRCQPFRLQLVLLMLGLVLGCKPKNPRGGGFSKILADVSSQKAIYVELAKDNSGKQLLLLEQKLLNIYLVEQGELPLVVRGVSGYVQDQFVSSGVSEAKKGWPLPEAQYYLDPIYEESLNPSSKGKHFYYLTFDESMELHEEAPRFGMGIILDADFGEFDSKKLARANGLEDLREALKKRLENTLLRDDAVLREQTQEEVKKVPAVEKEIESSEDIGFVSLGLRESPDEKPGTAGELAIVDPKEFEVFENFVKGSSGLIEVIVDYDLSTVDAPDILLEWVFDGPAETTATESKTSSQKSEEASAESATSSEKLHCDAKKLDNAARYGIGIGGLDKHCGQGKPDRCSPKIVECLKQRAGKLPGQPPFCSILDLCTMK